MSSIKLTDNFGFSLEATNGGKNANFFKRLLSDAEFVFDTANLKSAGLLAIGGTPAPNLPFTLTAKGSAGIGETGVASLKIDSTCTAKLSNNLGEACAGVVKPFETELPEGFDIKSGGYLSFETSAAVNGSVSGTLDEFTFGMSTGKQADYVNTKFFPQLTSTKLADATRELLEDFTIPGDFSDVEFLPEQSVCSVAGKGSLKFSASVGYTFYTNALASTQIPLAGKVAVNACGKTDFAIAFTVDAGFRASILKVGDSIARILVERSRDKDFDEAVEVKAQVTSSAMGQDLLASLLGAISPNADDEIKQTNAKLSDDEKSAINDALKCAIQNNFELGLKAEFEQAIANDTLCLYELNLNAMSADAKSALRDAFHGDFTSLSAIAATANDGVTEVQSVSTTTNTSSRKLTVHLLNIFQAGSIATSISKETVKVTPGNDVVITDSETARTISFTGFMAKPEPLRRLLFTSAMITSAYKVGNTNVALSDLGCELVHFEFERNASAKDLARNLNALLMLGTVEDSTNVQYKQGPSTLSIHLRLAASDCRRLFLDNQKARSKDDYEAAGKSAMYRLIAPDPDQADLAALLTTAQLARWNKLSTADTLDQAAIALGMTNNTAAPYFDEMLRIKWWTQSMSALAQCVQAFQDAGANLDPKSEKFQKLHQSLTHAASQTSSQAQDYFAFPWGILATAELLAFAPKPEVTFVSPGLTIQVSDPMAPAKVAAATRA